MALPEHEERAFAALVAQLRCEPPPDDQRPLGRLVALAPSLACGLGGVLLLVAAHQEWLLGRLSFVSGFSAPSIALALVAVAGALVVASAVVGRAIRRPAAPDLRPSRNIGASI